MKNLFDHQSFAKDPKSENGRQSYALDDSALANVAGGGPGDLYEDDAWQYCWDKDICPMGYWQPGADNAAKKAACEQHKCASQDLGMGKVFCGKK